MTEGGERKTAVYQVVVLKLFVSLANQKQMLRYGVVQWRAGTDAKKEGMAVTLL
jgi:hypothetical protein